MTATRKRVSIPGLSVAALCAAALGAATLAFAGVTLPAPAQDAFTRLGLSLPNQATAPRGPAKPATAPAATLPDQASDRAKQVLQQLQSEGGCAFGHATAEEHGATLPAAAQAACSHGSAKHTTRHGPSQTGLSHSQRGRSHAKAAPHENRLTGDNASEIGRSNSTSAPHGSQSTGQTISGEVPPGPPSSTPPAAAGPPSGAPNGAPTNPPSGKP